MLLHQLREHLVLALESLFQGADLLLPLTFRAAWVLGFKGPRAVLEKLPLPLIEQAGSDPVLFAQIRHRFAFQQMEPEDFDFLLGTEVPPF